LQGLPATQFAILGLLGSLPPPNTREVAQHLDLAVSTLVRATDGLERKGRLIRRRHSEDGRRVVLSLTENCRQAREHLAPARRARLSLEMFDGEVRALMIGFSGPVRATAVVHEIEWLAM